jgi:hypothetical protein
MMMMEPVTSWIPNQGKTVQICSEAYAASYPMGAGGKAAKV